MAGTIVASHDSDEPGSMRVASPGYEDLIDAAHVATCVCPAGLCTEPELTGRALVKRRVRVYWPEDDAFYPGVVTAYARRGDVHQVTYDDGEVLWDCLWYASGRPGLEVLEFVVE